VPFLIGGMNMNDMEFIKTLKEKRNAYGYSQTRLAQKKMNPKNLQYIIDIQVSQSRWICTLMLLKQEQMWKCEVLLHGLQRNIQRLRAKIYG
jgi:hypothetical protein